MKENLETDDLQKFYLFPKKKFEPFSITLGIVSYTNEKGIIFFLPGGHEGFLDNSEVNPIYYKNLNQESFKFEKGSMFPLSIKSNDKKIIELSLSPFLINSQLSISIGSTLFGYIKSIHKRGYIVDVGISEKTFLLLGTQKAILGEPIFIEIINIFDDDYCLVSNY